MCRADAPATRALGASTFAERLTGTLAWFVPLAVAASRISVLPSWQADLGNLRSLALVEVGPAGGVSTAISQIARLLPLGSATFRTAAIGAVTLAIAARLLFGVALAFLRSVEAARSSWLAPILATVAALMTTLTPSYELEATASGGAIVAVAGLWGVVALSLGILGRTSPRPAIDAVFLGGLAGATLAEDMVCGVLALVYLVGAYAIARRRQRERLVVPERALRAGGLAFAATALVFSAPFVLRALAARTMLDMGVVGSARLAGIVETQPTVGVFSVLVRDVGWVPLGLAAAGACSALLARRVRRELAPLFVFAIADGLAPLVLPRRLVAVATFASWDLAALAVLSIAFVTGVHASVSRLERVRLPLARPAAALVVVFQLVLVALVAEQAGDRVDRGTHRSASEWTDSALEDLPGSSAVLVRTPAFELRLLAAQFTEGVRPDVVVIPESLLGRGGIAGDIASREHSTEQLIRTIALAGKADELALAGVAEQRRLFVEPSPAWDRRVAIHASPDEALMAFLPQPMSVVEQRAGLVAATPARSRLLATVAPDAPADPEALRLIRSLVKGEATALIRADNPATAGELIAIARHAASGEVIDLTSAEMQAANAEALVLDRVRAKERALSAKPRVADQEKRRTGRRR